MIKSSNISVVALADFIRQQAISPRWMNMKLPPGSFCLHFCLFLANSLDRTMSQCMTFAEQLGLCPPNNGGSPPTHMQTPPPILQPTRPPTYPLWPPPDTGLEAQANSTLSGHIRIQPRPGSEPPSQPPKPITRPRSQDGKRGRPSKSDMAKRDLNIQLPPGFSSHSRHPPLAAPVASAVSVNGSLPSMRDTPFKAYDFLSGIPTGSEIESDPEPRARKRKRADEAYTLPSLATIREQPPDDMPRQAR